MRYINELREGQSVIEHYLCKSRQSLKSRAGKTYLSLKLQDKTGMVDAKVWEMTNDIKAFEENEFIKIDATVVTYQNDIQLNVKRIRRSLEGEYDPADYIPCTEKNIEEMYQKLMSYIKTIQNPYIKKLSINNRSLFNLYFSFSLISHCSFRYFKNIFLHVLSIC